MARGVALRGGANSLVLVATLGLLSVTPAMAQVWATQAFVQASLAATTNAIESRSSQAEGDVIAALHPALRVSRRSANFELSGEIGAELVGYTQGTQPNRLWPDVSADLHWTIYERALFLDANFDAHSEESDPYSGTASSETTYNQRTATAARISPYALIELDSRWSLLGRVDAGWYNPAAEEQSSQEALQGTLRIERLPVPWGLSAEWVLQDFHYGGTDQDDLRVETLRLGANYSFDGQYVVGLTAGREKSRVADDEESDPLYGIGLRWNPGPRTLMTARVEHRFFGTGWLLEARHRLRSMMFALSSAREPAGSASVGGISGSRRELVDSIDAILVSRYPDPIERERVVNDLIAARGLQPDLIDAVPISADYAQVMTGTQASWVWFAGRNTMAVSLYEQTARELVLASSAPPSTRISDYRQRGAGMQFNRRLTPQTSLDALWSWTDVAGLASRSDDRSVERTYRLSLAQNLSPRSAMSFGLKYVQLDTTVDGLHSYEATSAFVGVDHRF